ncbi:hypothetical protein R3W88_002738 [Solanum pinnatisectum]|uniref:Uncharacterized protein n=1 Tax=Solanum pinnatisectum TaxID=50273 RepID=A0AAV9MMC3_9SOLN|nr:hypothetical protein R3W88_002738 [Solanum pinnatisectum]
MKKKSRLVLQLSPPLPHDHSMMCLSTIKQITNFHHAQVGVYDTSELQALAILWLARGGMKSSNLEITSSFQFHLHRPYGLSLKKSLHIFMQKRRNRIKQPIHENKKEI